MKYLSLFFIILVLTTCSYNKTDRAGFFNPLHSIQWTDKIILSSDYYVAPLDNLYINSNTVIVFDSSSPLTILIDGSLQVFGSATAPIIFSNTQPIMNSIILEESSQSNQIKFCDFGRNNLLINTDITITQCKIKYIKATGKGISYYKHNNIGFLQIENQCQIHAEANLFDRALFDLPEPDSHLDKIIEFNGTGNCYFISNDFIGRSDKIVPATNYIIFDYSSGDLIFENNFWHTTNTENLIFTNNSGVSSLNPNVSALNSGCSW